jgi:polar amino acid transport system substrate-binding protein
MIGRMAILMLTLPILVLIGAGTARAAADKCDTVIVTGHPDYVPISWQEGEKLEGAAIDLVRLIGQSIGVKVKSMHTGSWKRAQAAVRSGEADLITGIYRTQEREEIYAFTAAFASEPVVVVTLSSTDIRYRQRSDLEPYQGGKVIGDSLGQEVDQYVADHLKIHSVPSLDHLMNLLDHKRIQYVLHGLYPVLVSAHKMGMGPRIRTLVPPLTQEAMYIGISRRSACAKLVPQFSAEIEKMRTSGAIDLMLKSNWDKWAKSENTGLAPPSLPDMGDPELQP